MTSNIYIYRLATSITDIFASSTLHIRVPQRKRPGYRTTVFKNVDLRQVALNVQNFNEAQELAIIELSNDLSVAFKQFSLVSPLRDNKQFDFALTFD